MHLNKIGLLALSMSAIFMANSCGNNGMSYEQTLKWVTDHYTKEGQSITAKSGKTKVDFSATKGEEARAVVRLMFSAFDLDENMKYEEPLEGDELIHQFIGPSWLEQYYGKKVEGVSTTFTVAKNCLTIKQKTTSDGKDETEMKGTMTEIDKINEEGVIIDSTIEMSVSYIGGEKPINGIKGTYTLYSLVL